MLPRERANLRRLAAMAARMTEPRQARYISGAAVSEVLKTLTSCSSDFAFSYAFNFNFLTKKDNRKSK